MNSAQKLHKLGQSLWLDNITRDLVTNGTLQYYIDELAVTGLTSNPTIFEKAIKEGDSYSAAIQQESGAGKQAEAIFFDLAIEDLVKAADLLRPIHVATKGMDGWVSLEVSPLLADDTAATIAAALELFKRAHRPNLFIKIPGTAAGLAAIEESIFSGVAVNVTLLFSSEQYIAAAEAYMRGIERRIAAGLSPKIGSVASIFISRWDVSVNQAVPQELRNQLGLAIARRTYKVYCELLNSPRWQKLSAAGAQPQRLLWASTGSKDKQISESYYVSALAAPNTINTIPEQTLVAFAKRGELSGVMSMDGGDAEIMLANFTQSGVDIDALAAKLQKEGAAAFTNSWNDLLAVIAHRST